MMSEASRKMVSHTQQNDRGPDYFGYCKHSVLELFSQNEDIRLAISGLESEPSAGTYSGAEVGRFSGSDSFFNDQIVEGLSDFKRERLKILLNQSVIGLNQEIDEIHGRILAMFQIEEDLKEKELGFSSDDLEEPESRSQKSSMPDKFSKAADMCQSQSFRKVFEDFQVLPHDVGLEAEDAVDKCFTDILAELGQMEQNLEEYLNILASKCRQMTPAEKELLGQRIHKLPIKALDRIVEIVHCRKSSEKQLPDKIHIDLEKEDNATLWRLYFYVKTVARANNSLNIIDMYI